VLCAAAAATAGASLSLLPATLATGTGAGRFAFVLVRFAADGALARFLGGLWLGDDDAFFIVFVSVLALLAAICGCTTAA
jgi:hypothetical protein